MNMKITFGERLMVWRGCRAMVASLMLAVGMFGGTGCAFGGAGQAEQLVLVGDGQSRFEIVVEANAFETTRLAGRELQTYMKKATGVVLPIVTKPTTGRGHVFVSATDELEPNGFAIQAHEGHLYIRGHDTAGEGKGIVLYKPVIRGTCNGVYAFLERFVGVRWFWNDPLGVIVPRMDRVKVPANLVMKEEPRFEYRMLVNMPVNERKGDWARWNRLGTAHGMAHGHALQQIVPVDEWAKKGRPEYAAETGGKRRIKKPGSSGGHVCMAHPDVIKLVSDAAIDHFRRHPELDMFSLSPPDGSSMCRDERCQAWDDLSYRVPFGPRKNRYPVLTDRVLRFYNTVAERVSAVHPDKLLGGYIYMDYQYPPRHVKEIHPNLALVVTPNYCCENWDEDYWKYTRDLFRAWGRLHDRVYAHDTCYRIRRSYGMPSPMGRRLIDEIRSLDSSQMRGCYLYVGQTWELMGHEAYLMAKMLWNPKVDASRVADEYYGLLYQQAGPAIRRFYKLAGESWRRTWTADETEVNRLANLFGRCKHDGPESLARILIGYEDRINAMREAVSEAEQKSQGDQSLERRVSRVRDCLTLAETTVAILRTVANYESANAKDARKLQPMVKQVQRREEVLKRIGRGYGAKLSEALRWADDRDDVPMRFGGYHYKLATNAGRN